MSTGRPTDSERAEPNIHCPFCLARGLTILSVANDYRSITVKCNYCLRESRLAFPPVGSTSD